MKITDFAIIFIAILIPLSLSVDISQKRSVQTQELKQRYNEIICLATEDATCAMLQQKNADSALILADGYKHGSKAIELNLERGLQAFYETIYLNMGIDEDKVAQDAIRGFIPLKMAVGYDRYFVHTVENVTDAAGGMDRTQEMWLPGKPYSYYDAGSGLVVNFTLDEAVNVYDTSLGLWRKGDRKKLQLLYPAVSLFEASNFDNIRRSTIVSMLRDDLEYYTARNNALARSANSGYIYNIPYISQDTWNNTINDIGFIAFFQGLTFAGVNEHFNTYGFGGSRLTGKKRIFASSFNGMRYYHIKGCPQLNVVLASFENCRDAAKNGYYPCPYCNP